MLGFIFGFIVASVLVFFTYKPKKSKNKYSKYRIGWDPASSDIASSVIFNEKGEIVHYNIDNAKLANKVYKNKKYY